MRRLAFLLILLLLIPSISQARPIGIYRTVGSGTVTQANMKLSGVDGGATASGGAFVDFGYKYSSDFSAGVDGWSNSTGTAIAGNIDGIGGQDNVLRVTCDTSDDYHYFKRDSVYTVGRKSQVTFKVFIPSTNSIVTGFRLRGTYWGNSADEYLYPIADTWTTYTKVFTSSSPTFILYLTAAGNDYSFQDAGGDDVFYIKDVKVEEFPLTSYLGHLLKITDSAGKSIMGYIKAAGTGETLGDEKVDTWTNANYETLTLSGSDITQAVNSNADSARAYKQTDLAQYSLAKAVINSYTKTSGTAPIFHFSAVNNGLNTATGSKNTGAFSAGTYYGTISVANSYCGFRNASNDGDWSATGISFKQVLTPSATGVTIVSAQDGTQYNWFNKNSAFNWNDASGYTYQIIQENGKHIYSSAITSGTLHLDASNTAMFFHDSIDFSSYAGTDAGSTPYLIAFYDSSGYMASAYAGAVGGGESLDSNISSLASLNLTSGWSTLTSTINDSDTFTISSTSGSVHRDDLLTAGKIYKTEIVGNVTAGTLRASGNGNAPVFDINGGGSTYGTCRIDTTSPTRLYIQNYNGNNGAVTDITSISMLKVLDVPVTGLHLFTTKNGTTRGMASQASSFNPNTITSVKIYRAY